MMKSEAAREAVRKQGLEACKICGGAVDPGEKEHLRCECAAQVARLAARAAKLAYDAKTESWSEDADRLAP